MVKRQGWDVVALGLPIIRAHAPEMRFLFAGVVSLKRLLELARLFPESAFTNTSAHYLAQRHVRLQRVPDHDTRLIKEPVDGHPDLILAENVRLYQEVLASKNGSSPQSRASAKPSATDSLHAALNEVVGALRKQFGFAPAAAYDAFHLLATDETVLAAFQTWLRSDELDRDFRGSFPTWPCADGAPHPTLGQLQDEGADPLDAFLHLGHLARRVDEEIQVFVGQAGY